MEAFEDLRPKLFGIAYRMLGSVMEAEDVVQDAYLRFQEVDPARVQSPEAFLRTIVTRLSLDQLKSARVQREAYYGNWLPEPLPTADEDAATGDPAALAGLQESISMAFLLLLESLTPDERAVFLLHEVFDYDYGEIALMLNKSAQACRQLLSRARKHVTENRPRFRSSPETHRQMLARFMQAAQSGDLAGLTAVLTEDVTSYGDGGGKVAVVPHPVHGREAVARLMLGFMRLVKPGDILELTEINEVAGYRLRNADGLVTGVLCFETTPDGIRGIYFVGNPDKLRHWQPQ